ncbi:MAG: CBS domain-containing protein, partial [Trebonia sp.]
LSAHHPHAVYPVYEQDRPVGVMLVRSLAAVPLPKWEQTTIGELAERRVTRVSADVDLMEALRLLMGQRGQRMLLVTDAEGRLEGLLTKSDILNALATRDAGQHVTGAHLRLIDPVQAPAGAS